MKNVLLTMAALVFGASLSAQIAPEEDWAGFGRYAEMNKQVDHHPKAVFIGDSITDLWDDKEPEFFTGNDILCRGISGQTTSQMLVRFRKDVLAHHPQYALIMAGTNDIARNNGYIALDDIVGNIVSMCELARKGGVTPIIVSITPCKLYLWRTEVEDPAGKIIEVNRMLEAYAKKERIRYVDLHSVLKDEQDGLPAVYSQDEVHPTLEGYKVMGPVILEAISSDRHPGWKKGRKKAER